MATHAATRNISGLARALAQHGVMSEYEAEALQTQAQSAGVDVRRAGAVRQADDAPSSSPCSRSRAFGVPLLDLAALRRSTRSTRSTSTSRSPSRGGFCRCTSAATGSYVAISDPANLQALEEVRFKTNLVVEPVVVEDDKLAPGDRQARRGERRHAEGAWPTSRTSRSALEDGTRQPSAADEDEPRSRTRRSSSTSRRSCSTRSTPAPPTSTSSRTRSSTASATALDGILMEVAQPPLAIKDKVASRIKVISKLDISEKRVPQDGRMKLVLSKTQGDRLPRLDAADAVRREDRDADPRFGGRQARHRGAGLRARPAGGAAARDRPAVRHDPRDRARPAAARRCRSTPASTS